MESEALECQNDLAETKVKYISSKRERKRRRRGFKGGNLHAR